MRTDVGRDAPLDHRRLLNLVVFEYRSSVVARLGVMADWRVLEWTGSAACTGREPATAKICERCPVAAECLAAAITGDDQAEWRGGPNPPRPGKAGGGP